MVNNWYKERNKSWLIDRLKLVIEITQISKINVIFKLCIVRNREGFGQIGIKKLNSKKPQAGTRFANYAQSIVC